MDDMYRITFGTSTSGVVSIDEEEAVVSLSSVILVQPRISS